ncbi:DNA polymerase/3'-5' exonuclease PolX [Candidatus Wolfebacteria bacterium]|nr:DNA polymerase/3'-5' exonuclease PolX [Candidatus Wolfebacteria bacterium]
MINQEIAKIFRNFAFYFEMQDIAFKPQAYRKAADAIEALSQYLEEIYKSGGIKFLEEISGIGKSMAEKIEEYIKTGKIKEYRELKKKIPVEIAELIAVEGVGPKAVRDLYEHLKIKNLKDLEKAAKAGKIRELPRFGVKSEQKILEGIAFLKKSGSRFLLGEILPKVKAIKNALKNLKEVKKVEVCGSIRRRKETIGDVDFLVSIKKISQPAVAKAMAGKVMDFFVSLPGVVKIWGKGATKTSIRTKDGFDMDIRVVPKKSFGAALQYFTGSKEHNIILRKIAIEKGLKLNEYGLFNGLKMIAGEIEEEIYEKLGAQWISPEMRENQGEIELSLKGKLPELIELKDIKGDLHCHSHWGAGNGKEGIENLIKMAIEMGYEYIGISDHTKFLRIEHGLDEKQLMEQKKEIDKLNHKLKIENCKLKILRGCEANIMADGSIDIKDEALEKLDYVIAGVHSQMNMPKEKMTERIIKAMRNPNVDIISHPTGRILKQRDEYEMDFEKILEVAKETKIILEINANPYRLDLNDKNIRKAKKAGVKMIINSDAHQKNQMGFMEYGVFQARRGWAEKKDIINCRPVDELLLSMKPCLTVGRS